MRGMWAVVAVCVFGSVAGVTIGQAPPAAQPLADRVAELERRVEAMEARLVAQQPAAKAGAAAAGVNVAESADLKAGMTREQVAAYFKANDPRWKISNTMRSGMFDMETWSASGGKTILSVTCSYDGDGKLTNVSQSSLNMP